MKKQKNGLLLNLFLLLVVCVLFAATDIDRYGKLPALQASAPVYRGKGSAVAPLCVVNWRASALEGILDTLQSAGQEITFAVSGEWARENPELLSRIATSGHEIALCGNDPGFDGGLSAIVEDLETAAEAVEEITGRRPKYYFSGERNLNVSSRAAEKCKLTHIQSTLDLLCARGEAEDIVQRALESAGEGSIILIQPTKTLEEALPSLIELFRTKGMEIAVLSEIL